MAINPLRPDFAPRRIFLRVPIHSSAMVFVEAQPPQAVQLNDISSGGLSFFMPATQSLPDYFNIEFHLEPAGKPIKATLAVRNRVPAGEKIRIGCTFFVIKEADKNHITQHICKFTNLTKPLKALSLATLICYIDALWRIPAYFLYCRGVEFERLSKVAFFYRFYFFILLLYAASAACGFILSGRPAEKFGKPRFLISLGCLSITFVFMVIKTSNYLIFSFANALPLFLDVFIWGYLMFALYVSYALILTLGWVRKIDVTAQILERHSAFAG
jgi:hypothetical protein